MKKIKILSLLMALLLSSSLLLASCGSKKEEETESESESETETVVEEVELTKYGIADIMNASYSPTLEEGAYSNIGSPLSYVGDFVGESKGFFITDDGSNIRVYNTATDTAVSTLNYETNKETANGKYSTKLNYVDVISEDYYAILTMSYVGDYDHEYFRNWSMFPPTYDWYGSDYYKDFYKTEYVEDEAKTVSFCSYTITVYDANGTAVDTYGNTEICSLCKGNANGIYKCWYGDNYDYNYGEDGLRDEYEGYDSYVEDLYTKGSEVYRKSYVDGTPKYELVKDFGIAAIPEIDSKVGDYYLDKTSNTYTVYNKDLSVAYSYTIPSDAYGEGYLLSNGNLLVQYVKRLNQEETVYDYRSGSDGKYSLTTLIVTAEGEKKLEDVDFRIKSLVASTADKYGDKQYVDAVENLAFICYISEDKTIDTNYGNASLVLLSNDCEVTAEVEIDGDINDFPKVLDKGIYAVSLVKGDYDYYNAKGEKMFTRKSLSSAKYTVSDNRIYGFDGALVYDGNKEKTEVTSDGDFIKILNYGETTVGLSLFFGADNIVNVGVQAVDPTIDVSKVANAIGPVNFDDDGVCGVHFLKNADDANSKEKYVFYNEEGKVIATLEEKGDGGYSVQGYSIENGSCILVESYYADGDYICTYYKAIRAK